MPENDPPKPTDATAESKAITIVTDRAIKRADRIAQEPERALNVLEAARVKADRSRDSIQKVLGYVSALIRMLRAHFNRTYRDLPWRSVVVGLGAIVYFVAPIDLIPDLFFGGLIDDAAVIMFVVRQIQNDLDAYLRWEAQQDIDDGE